MRRSFLYFCDTSRSAPRQSVCACDMVCAVFHSPRFDARAFRTLLSVRSDCGLPFSPLLMCVCTPGSSARSLRLVLGLYTISFVCCAVPGLRQSFSCGVSGVPVTENNQTNSQKQNSLSHTFMPGVARPWFASCRTAVPLRSRASRWRSECRWHDGCSAVGCTGRSKSGSSQFA